MSDVCSGHVCGLQSSFKRLALWRAVLDLADTLHHIVAHLTSQECQNLRHTCKLLRHHAAVVVGVHKVEDAAEYQEGLPQLRGLCSLTLVEPLSVFDLHHLNSHPRLTNITIVHNVFIDLKPLSCLASLRSLALVCVKHYVCLDSLTQLRKLDLIHTVAKPVVLLLSALTWLGLAEGSQAADLAQLSQLEALDLSDDEKRCWTAARIRALTAAVRVGLPTLHSLTCPLHLLPPLDSLAQLKALSLYCHRAQQLPAHLQDLRPLTGLVKLGLDGFTGQSNLLS